MSNEKFFWEIFVTFFCQFCPILKFRIRSKTELIPWYKWEAKHWNQWMWIKYTAVVVLYCNYSIYYFKIILSYPSFPDLFQIFCYQLLLFSLFLYWHFNFHQVPSLSITGALLFIFGLMNLVSPGSFSTSLTSSIIYFFFLIIMFIRF